MITIQLEYVDFIVGVAVWILRGKYLNKRIAHSADKQELVNAEKQQNGQNKKKREFELSESLLKESQLQKKRSLRGDYIVRFQFCSTRKNKKFWHGNLYGAIVVYGSPDNKANIFKSIYIDWSNLVMCLWIFLCTEFECEHPYSNANMHTRRTHTFYLCDWHNFRARKDK